MKKKIKILSNLLFWGGIVIILVALCLDALIPKWPMLLMCFGVLLNVSTSYIDRQQ